MLDADNRPFAFRTYPPEVLKSALWNLAIAVAAALTAKRLGRPT